MHGQLLLVLAAAALLTLLAQVPTGSAECCYPTTYYGKGFSVKRCADCSRVRVYYCGIKEEAGCNIFGCNCKCIQPTGKECGVYGGDRDDTRTRRDVTSAALSMPAGNVTGHDVIIAGDLDKDGHLDEVEVHLYLTQRGVAVDDVTAWRDIDANKDGRLTASEIDNELRGINDLTPV